MPIDPRISLETKPVDIKPVNYPELYRTLAQMRYLGAETQAAEDEAARKRALFGEQAAAGGVLASLGRGSSPTLPTPAAPPQPGAPIGGPPFDEATLGALRQGASTPPPVSPAPAGATQGAPGAGGPGGPQAPQPRPSLLDDTVRAEIYKRAPHAAEAFIKSGLEIESFSTKAQTDQLELGAKFLDHSMRSLSLVNDQPTYDAWKLSMAAHIPQEMLAQLPDRFSPDLVTRLQQSTQAVADQVKYKLDQQKVANETKNAETNRIMAETGQKAEARQQTENLVLHGEQGDVLVPRYGNLPGGTGTTAPVPGTERPRTPGETQAKGQLDMAAASNARIALLEANMANGKGLTAIVPSLAEEVKMTKGGALGNKFLDPARREYYGEMLNFIAAVRGEETSRISPETFNLEARRFFPIAGDTEADVLRKRQVREDALSALATRTNRPQGMVPRGQTLMPQGSPAPAAGAPKTISKAQLDQLEEQLRTAGKPRSRAQIEQTFRNEGYTIQ